MFACPRPRRDHPGEPDRSRVPGDLFTGVAVNPHLIRDIWATEYLQAHPGDYETVADRLGNTVPVVIRYCGHI
jgi:hypothetical protein